MNFCQTCGKCCFETEMQLSLEDLGRIAHNNPFNYSKEDFAFFNEESKHWQIKTKPNDPNKPCIFLKISKDSTYECSIYSFRPKGCQIYPLVFDLDENKCIFDKYCPKPEVIYKSKKKTKAYCRQLKQFLTSMGLLE
jgi:uncharacterized protein